MNCKKLLGKYLSSLILLIVLVTPSVIQFSHIFEEHEHIACTETESHVHKTDVDCETCAFRIMPFNDDFNVVNDFSLKKSILKKEVNYTSLILESHNFTHKQLRAPPKYS